MVRLFGKIKEETKVDETKSEGKSAVQEVVENSKEKENEQVKKVVNEQQVVIEREINLSLLNEKLNVVLSLNQEILQILKGEE
jgi:hypothetical protein